MRARVTIANPVVKLAGAFTDRCRSRLTLRRHRICCFRTGVDTGSMPHRWVSFQKRDVVGFSLSYASAASPTAIAINSMTSIPAPVDCISLATTSRNACPEVYRRVTTVCKALRIADYEIVLVDDGSSDQTRAIIRQCCEQDPRVVGVFLSAKPGWAIRSH